MKSLPALANVGSLLFLILFIYSILGNSYFPYLRKQVLGGIIEFFNYQSFVTSFFSLMRNSTDDDLDISYRQMTATIQPNKWCFDIGNYEDFLKYGIILIDSRFHGMRINCRIFFPDIILHHVFSYAPVSIYCNHPWSNHYSHIELWKNKFSWKWSD